MWVCLYFDRESESICSMGIQWNCVLKSRSCVVMRKGAHKRKRKSHEITYELIFPSMKMDRNKLLGFIVDKQEWNFVCINGLPYLEMYVLSVGCAWKRRWCSGIEINYKIQWCKCSFFLFNSFPSQFRLVFSFAPFSRSSVCVCVCVCGWVCPIFYIFRLNRWSCMKTEYTTNTVFTYFHLTIDHSGYFNVTNKNRKRFLWLL